MVYLLYGEERYLLENKNKKNKKRIWRINTRNKLYTNRRNRNR